MQLLKNFSLKSYNTFGIEAKCALFCEVKSPDTIADVIGSTDFKSTPKLVLGGGSNILFTKDFNGLVLKNSLKGITVEREDAEHIWVKAAAGEVWHELVLFCIKNNY